MYVWGASQRGAPVQVNVIGTIMFLLALAFVFLGQLLSRRREKAA
jgi:spermidine/putrescine transport system permease protein